MAQIVIRMSDEQKARLESYRAANGLRSLNAAMLHLIDHSPIVRIDSAKFWPNALDAAVRDDIRATGTAIVRHTASGPERVSPAAVQFGPTPRKPGDLAKKGKKP